MVDFSRHGSNGRTLRFPLLVLVLFVTAARAEELPAGVTVERDVVYARRSDGVLRLDLFRPSGMPGPFGTVVLLHGERPRARERGDFELLAQHIAKRGYVAASVEYRTLRQARYPAALDDVRIAIEWLRQNAATRQIAIDRLVLAGENFGGYLASLVALAHGSERLRIGGVVAIHAPSDLLSYRPFDSYPTPTRCSSGFPSRNGLSSGVRPLRSIM